ncbi:unnamed protein product [Medioppia subpectinata]|uniref:Dystroglycan 1 n=1 Tax=Medioppia subpectinata TaxID=1979941 RepID=A0A7R9KMV8_9ACAR|nr:unnamed protein product [Medioppia subpectinata]CAG2106178.1 unnamed protein product [Medioppia subpectinata]
MSKLIANRLAFCRLLNPFVYEKTIDVKCLSTDLGRDGPQDSRSGEDVVDYDIVINGGGIVGFSTLLSLNWSPFLRDRNICLIERQLETNVKSLDRSDNQFSNRVSAITKSSQRFFERIGVWDQFKEFAKPVKEFYVWSHKYNNAINFTHDINDGNEDNGLVCYVIENNRILSSLQSKLNEMHSNVFYETDVTDITSGDNCLKIDTKSLKNDNKKSLRTKLLIGCDGFQSIVRQKSNLTNFEHDLEELAIVATLHVSPGDGNVSNDIAFQRFVPLDNSVIGLLPLNQEFSSLVWSVPKELAKPMMEMSEQHFVDHLNDSLFIEGIQSSSLSSTLDDMISRFAPKQVFNQQIPRYSVPHMISVLPNSRAVFPLKFGTTLPYLVGSPHGSSNNNRIVIIGDAAHRVHPLAGQGLNLGVGDADVLSQCLHSHLYAGERLFGENISDFKELENCKLFHHRIQLTSSHDVKSIHVGEAGDGLTLPDWLYFKRDTNELIGLPFEKGLFFIEVRLKYCKLFHHRIQLTSSHDVKSIHVGEAGDGLTLPNWLYFKRDTNELIGLPFEKGLFFIEVRLKYYGKQQLNDIFAIEVTDGSSQAANHLSQYRCVLRIKQTFDNISDVWHLISSLIPNTLISNQKSQAFSDWLQRFSISRNTNKQYLITYDIENCDTNTGSKFSDDHYISDDIGLKLKTLGFESDMVQITRKQLDDNQLFNDMMHTSNDRIGGDTEKRNSHYRRNVANGIHPTPILAPDWMTLTTSTIIPSIDSKEPTQHDPLSRVLIPSMISPTVTASSPTVSLPAGDPIENSILNGHDRRHHHLKPNKFQTPFIYTTPVLAPERPTLVDGHEDLFTPIPVTQTPSHHSPHLSSETIMIAPSPSVAFDITPSLIDVTTERPTTSAAEIPSSPSSVPNKTPYINKRIRKLELISGKYWKYTIPSETFVDFEDGDTRKLKLTFLMSTSGSTQEQPSSDFWIQFDHENQYLFALPTDEDIGKHIFNLVAVDSSGAHVTEALEVHVRQHKNTRAFTHVFALSNVVWDPYQFSCLIDATASLLKRVTTRLFGDSNIQTIAVQKITKNDRENSWTISWTNDTLPTHPCPREAIQSLYSSLRDTHKVIDDSSAEPSRLLRQTLSPEFQVQKVHLNFIAKSACGSYEIPDIDDKKPKEQPIIRNRIGKLGPFRLGEAFRYKVPEDTVYSPARQVGTRDLTLTCEAIEPHEMPSFMYFDSDDQELFGLALTSNWVNSYELKLLAEDTIIDGSVSDIFSVEISDEIRDQTKQPLFEVIINVLTPQVREDLTVKEQVDIVQRISSGMFSDGDSSAVHIISIKKYQYDGLAPAFPEDNNYLDSEPIDDNSDNKGHRIHRHDGNHDSVPKTRHSKRESNPLYYYEYKWTNRTIVGHDNCPQHLIKDNILNRIFKRSYDSLKSLKDVFEPNYEFINVEFEPLGACKTKLSPKVMGARPIPVTIPPSTQWTPTKPTPREEEDVENAIDIDESNEFLLTTIIPPVAILIALIFAAIVGCCFHRANRRRKSVEISSRLPTDSGLNEREAFLQKGRIPIIFEFEQQQHQQQNQFPPNASQQQYTPVIMPPPQAQHIPPQQMTPLRQLSSSAGSKLPYQAGSGPQARRQPPPYYK